MSTLPSHSSCPYCSKKLKVLVEQKEGRFVFSGIEPCTCPEGERELERRFKRSGIPNRYKATKCDTKPLTEALSDQRGAFITGSVGVGKTCMAAKVAQEMVSRGKSVVFTSSVALLNDLRDAYREGLDSSEKKARYLTAKYLFLDDLGKEKVTEWALEVLFELIDYRYNHELITVVTSQYSFSELIEHMTYEDDSKTAQAIMSRLFEHVRVIHLQGSDRRRVQHALQTH